MISKNISISRQITISILAAFASLFLGISFFIYFSVHALVLREVGNQLKSVHSQLVGSRNSNLKTLIASYKLDVAAYTVEGKKLYSNYPDNEYIRADEPGLRDLRIPSEQEGKGDFEAPDHFLVYRSGLTKGEPKLYFLISKDLEDEDRFFLILKELLAVSSLLGMAISVFTGHRISRRILKPVDLITGKAEAISAEDLSLRIPRSGTDDELSRLAGAFNAMLDRLEDSFARQERFVSAASHELRTPVSIIQGNAGMLQRWAKDNPALLEESLSAIRTETGRMKNLIDRLLFLAKNDSGSVVLHPVRVEITSFLQAIIDDYGNTENPPNFHLQLEEEFEFFCDPDLIRQVLLILIDNGIKYSGRNPAIEISAALNGKGSSCAISVKDKGSGIEEEHLPRLFDRFFRVDNDRSREKGGAGIGLSIAKEICEAHGGTLSVTSQIGEGSVFTLNLPVDIN